MKELTLKYGCNPNQKPSKIFMEEGQLPLEVLNGRPGYINFLDALNAWQLVKELQDATGWPAAASFKHVSPAGAAIGLPLTDTLKKIYFVDDFDEPLSPIACAYARARGADRMCSYGDFVALSTTCDLQTALLLKREVSDGVIAPSYTSEALAVLREKRKGTYNVIQIDPTYVPAPIDRRRTLCRCAYAQQNLYTRGETRPHHCTHYLKIYAEQLGLLCKRRAGYRHRSRPTESHPLHPVSGFKGRHLVAQTMSKGDEPTV